MCLRYLQVFALRSTKRLLVHWSVRRLPTRALARGYSALSSISFCSMTELPIKIPQLDDGQRQKIYDQPSVEKDPLHDGDLPIHKAAYTGDDAKLATLIASDANIDARGVYDCTPLQLAIRGDHSETVRILLTAGADPTLKDQLETAAYYEPFDAINGAAWLGNQNALAALLKSGLKLPASALRWAASLNHVQCMRKILDQLGQNDFVDKPRSEGLLAALERAALCWHLEAVELILSHVTPFPSTLLTGKKFTLSSALVSAAGDFDCDDRCRWQKNGDIQLLVMKKLIMAGADVNLEHPQAGENAFWATVESFGFSTDIVRLLLKSGLHLDRSSEDGRTPLFGIISNRNNDVNLVKAFLEAGAQATTTDVELNTPLHVATHRSFAELLFEYGASLLAKNRYGVTPFHRACEDGRVGVAQFLLSHGAQVDEPAGEDRSTPLLFATGGPGADYWSPRYPEKQEQIVKLLLDHGANVEATSADGQTALLYTARSCLVSLARILINHGADTSATMSDGKTALHAVCEVYRESDQEARVALVTLLLDHGATLEARDENGNTPLHAAWSRPHLSYGFKPDLFNVLLKAGADRFAKDDEGRTPVDLIDTTMWMWNDSGMVQKRPEPVINRGHDSIRGSRGRGRGRGS